MGLAEPKRKVKYSLDPNALKWANDESKFGKRLLEKMGWEQGKGLGAKENGITENIKVKFKSDTKGVGFDNSQYENVWLDHQDDFESLLSNLNKTNEASNTSEKDQLQSLELKSKEAKGRLHYKKFAKSKDLTNASSHDLNCILGKEKRIKLKSEKNYETEVKQGNESGSDYEEAARVSFKLNTVPVPLSNGDATSSKKTSNELFSTNKLSLNDYFASKMASKLNKSQEKNDEEIQRAEKDEEDSDEVTSKAKKKKKRKSNEKEIEEQTEPLDEEIVTNEKKKKKKKKNDEKEKCENQNEEITVIKEEKNSDLAMEISKSFNGSNLHKIKGYSPYNITSSLETLVEEKAKRTQMKQAVVAKNLEKDPKFYEMKKK